MPRRSKVSRRPAAHLAAGVAAWAIVSILLLAPVPAPAQVAAVGGNQPDSVVNLVCSSKRGERQTCAADTQRGVTLVKSTGPGACERGKSWGYDEKAIWVSDGCSGEFAIGKKGLGYTPAGGFKVFETDRGDLSIRVFTYVRYLNQMGLDPVDTNSFGQTRSVKQRQDFQVNKGQVYFFGWFMSRKLRYLLYVWSTNASQGLPAQVLVAGNLTYDFNKHLKVGAGILGLPGVRSTSGNFPFWLAVDARHIADEFFRPSYTTGIWAGGQIVGNLSYDIMLANNLSQLGVDAGQLDNGLNTWSGAVTWLPTTGEFGKTGGFGDFENHQKPATRVAGHYTRSDENRQGQPDTEGIENVQIRLSDGSIIFTPDLFGPGIQIEDVTYQMASLDAGVKYLGFALEGEYYWRRLDNFRGAGTAGLPFDDLNDHGFQLQGSAMVLPAHLQAYAGTSKVFGEYGDPWDFRLGLNWFPWKNLAVRWNFEYLQLGHSPVGALSLPYPMGGNGSVFQTNFVIWF